MQWFVDHFDKQGIPFTNIVNKKGYRCISMAACGQRENSCFFSRHLQGAIENSTLVTSIDRQ
jgi:hypothetical protein